MTLNGVILIIIAACLLFLTEPVAADESMRSIESKAKSGEAEAQFQLGRSYFRGEGQPQDDSKALEWIGKAAAGGNADAMTSMGFFYTQGIGVEKSDATALEWFRKGAQAGSLKSKLNLGLLLRQGRDIQHNNDESLRFMHEAADAGLPEALSYLAKLYFTGDELVDPDYPKAAVYARQAAESGDAQSQNILGLIMLDGLEGTPDARDPENAERWFRKAAEQGEVKAQANLAHLMGVESPASTNRVEALMWLLLAKDSNEATSVKTYNEISAALPEGLLEEARNKAAKFLLRQGQPGNATASP